MRCYNSLDSSGLRHKSISEVGQWCWVIRSGSQIAFQVQKVLDGVEVIALCRSVKFFHIKLGKNISSGIWLWGWGHCRVEKWGAFLCFKYSWTAGRETCQERRKRDVSKPLCPNRDVVVSVLTPNLRGHLTLDHIQYCISFDIQSLIYCWLWMITMGGL